MHIQSFINSSFCASAKSFEKKNPFSLEPLHRVDSCDALQVVQAIGGAQKAFIDWKESSLVDRIALLNKIASIIEDRKSEFSKLESTDQGLNFRFTANENIDAAKDCFIQSVQQLKNYIQQREFSYSATGVITIIASWNLSLRVISERLAPALAAGNAVLVKVSSQSPVTAYILAEVLRLSDAPKGLVQVLVSDDLDVKNLLVCHPGIKAVSFVGQLKNASEVLKKLANQSLNQFKKIQIATGSKNTAVALTDPDTTDFLNVIESFMIGQGQLSWNSNRLFILEKFEKQWQQKIESYFSEIKPAESNQSDSMWGPCIRAESFSQFAEIEKMALTDQAKLIQPAFTLTSDQKKSFLKPTFTKDMSNCSTLQQDQVMAPLFILSVVKYPFDIAKYSNVSYYGQSAHIWAEEEKIGKIAEQLEVAQVFKNSWSVKHHQPNKGVKQSGFGIQDYQVFGDFFSNVKKMT